jgi:hypothetical protein
MINDKKYKKYISKKKYLMISRLNASLIGMFATIITIVGFFIHILIGVLLVAMSLGFLWYLIIDIMADRFEDRLIDYEELEGITKKK